MSVIIPTFTGDQWSRFLTMTGMNDAEARQKLMFMAAGGGGVPPGIDPNWQAHQPVVMPSWAGGDANQSSPMSPQTGYGNMNTSQSPYLTQQAPNFTQQAQNFMGYGTQPRQTNPFGNMPGMYNNQMGQMTPFGTPSMYGNGLSNYNSFMNPYYSNIFQQGQRW